MFVGIPELVSTVFIMLLTVLLFLLAMPFDLLWGIRCSQLMNNLLFFTIFLEGGCIILYSSIRLTLLIFLFNRFFFSLAL